MLVVACVAIIVVGPKDLPKVLRAFGKAMKSIRGLAGDFQKQFDEAMKEADLDEVKNIASGKGFKPLDDIKKSVTDFEKDVKTQMEARSADALVKNEPAGLPEPVARKLAEMDAKAESAKAAASKAEVKSAKKSSGAKAASAKSSARPPAKKQAAKKPDAKKPAAKPVAKPAASAGSKKATKSA